MNLLEGATVAVTGAAGFIGARTVEHLVLGTGCRVRALVRTFHRLGRLSELPQDRLVFHSADILDFAGLESAFNGCDVIVHCAYSSDGSADRQWHTTVHGTRLVIEAAISRSVPRFVHLSTAAVHDCTGLDTFDESAPKILAPHFSYEMAKLAAERIVAESRIDAIALRPTVVYGPWGKDWTARPIARLLRGVRGLPTGPDTGVSNAVYVDDVVRAIIRSCASVATGPVLVASDEIVSWGRFYDAMRALIKVPLASRTEESTEPWEQDFYSLHAKANIEKAGRLLGYAPKVSFSEGMSMVAAWGKWYGLVPIA